ncbi:Uu.00g129310.m01.CDS01 [Anthostomella pinea]|uniref:Uu.00g129310.m01.CDS01 n=1 Tax=Anthostomella pinea TaxID=933095 RepID=A0AAI8YI69_9PEZI|nr:Uu.00g129310.m01.CDS01 [Anthostomella pinea]
MESLVTVIVFATVIAFICNLGRRTDVTGKPSALDSPDSFGIMAQNKSGSPPAQSFPSTKPAMLFKTGFNEKFMCGDIYSGSTLVAVPLVGGTLESVGDFEPKFKFTVNSGADWFQIDADKQHGRLGIKAVATDDQGASVCIITEGVMAMNEVTMPLAFGSPDAKTSPFGFGVETFKIEAGDPKYKPLENMVFVGSQRFLQPEGGLVGVEARISQIVSGEGME